MAWPLLGPGVKGYTLLGELGRGGLGVVYRALDHKLKRQVALKMIRSDVQARPIELARFRREAEAVSRLQHPNIVHIYDFGEVDGRPYLCMELVEGCTLDSYSRGTPQPPATVAALVRTLAGAVQAMHERGIIHRDLKPANILLQRPHETEGAAGLSTVVPKVADFGLAKDLLEGGLTASCDVLGTPSYMAPEQAQGRGGKIGPATDVYALGAILYELLSGQPPFADHTAVETLVQVLFIEPVPLRRLRPTLPRDLETICLKCLHKDSGRRYATAQELADDLGRFLHNEPIRARPAGRLERGVRWVRRHLAVAATLVACLLLVIGLVGTGLWLRGQHSALVQAVEEDLQEAVLLQDRFAWVEATVALERAKGRLGKGGPARLHHRVAEAGRNLDQCRGEVQLAARLDAIRLDRATHVEGHFNSTAERRFTNARADLDYEEAFREAGVEEQRNDPAAVAARVRRSVVRRTLLAGLHDWAVCANGEDRQDWLLAVARQADPDTWRDRVRDPVAWRDRPALTELARTAPLADQPTPLLIALGERLQATGGSPTAFLKRVQQEHPSDFWANFALGRVLREQGEPQAAAAFYRKALQIHPEASVYNNLGLALYDLYQWDAAINCLEESLRLSPRSASAHNNLGLVLKAQGPWDKAVHHYRLALQLGPRSAPSHCNLGVIRAYCGGLEEAIQHYQEALRLDPRFALAHYMLGVALLGRGRFDAANDHHQRAVRLDPTSKASHDEVYGRALDNAITFYQRSIDLDPRWALAHNGLGLTQQDKRRLDEALDHYKQALRIDPGLALAEAARGQALLAHGRFREARAATRLCLDLLAQGSCRAEPHRLDRVRPNVTAQLRRCERLIALERRLPAIVQQTEKPTDAAEHLAFAELCAMKELYVVATRLYANALALAPQLAEDVHADHRYKAACTAALVGCGHGADVVKLSNVERTRWHQQAREWLRAELRFWASRAESGQKADRDEVLRRFAHWWTDPDLAVLRDPNVLVKLPPAERREWRTLWSDFDAQLAAHLRPPPQVP
jgi:serine/threonine-protein kinase